MSRKFSGVPAFVDYSAQALYWLEWNWPKPRFADWATRLVDFFCLCEQCEEAAKRGMPRNPWFEGEPK